MKIAIVQQHAKRDRQDNIARGLAAFDEAARAGAKLVAYAELGLEYFYPQKPAGPGVEELAEPIPGPLTDAFRGRARERGVVVVLNMFERDGGRTYDTSPVIDADGTIAGKVRMVHIAELPCFHEKGYYAPGDLGPGVFDTAVGRVGVAICYDRHFPEYTRALGLAGAQLVIIPQAGAVGEWPPGVYEAEIQIASFHNGYFCALANRVGGEECLTFAGESFVTGPDGRIVTQAPDGEDTILYADIDLAELDGCAAKKFFYRDRRPETYRVLTEEKG